MTDTGDWERPLRILTVADVPPDPNAGAAGTVYHTNVALRELGHHVDEIWADELGPRRIKHGNLHSLLEQPRAYRRAVLRRAAAREYDVVQMSQPQAYLAARALTQQKFRGLVINRSHGLELRVNAVLPEWHRKLRVPESRFPRSVLTPLLRRLLERQWSAVVGSCDGIIVPCHDDRDFLLRRLDVAPERVQVIHHGVPTEYLQTPALPQTEDRLRRLLYVGQFSFIKGPHILARVINAALARDSDLTMTWVTSAWAHAQVRPLLEPAILPRVDLRDWSSQAALLSVYDRHGVFIFPSFFEGAAKAAMEAMSRGLCVVASNTGGMRDFIQHGRSGYLCPVGDAEAFAGGVGRARASAVAAVRMGREATLAVSDRTWQACARRMVDFYRDRHSDGQGLAQRG